MTTKAKPLRNAQVAGGFVAPFRLSTDARSALSAVGWTEAMLAELDKRVEGARFDTSIPQPTAAQMVAALESIGQAAARLHAELKGLDWRTAHLLDAKTAEHLSDLETSPYHLREKLTQETMAISVLINAMLRDAPKPKRTGAPPKKLNNAVAVIVREIMVKHGQEPMAEGGSAALATTATLQELGVLAGVTARHPIRRAKTTR